MKISLVIPVFNEEKAIPAFYQALQQFDGLKEHALEVIFVNDGSNDQTEQELLALSKKDSSVLALNLSRNFGKEAALFAGIDHASGDAVIPMDVDLQDPLHVIPEMIDKWKKGADVVLAYRVNRSTDGFFKRHSAGIFYHVYNLMANVKIPHNVGDFRLMDRAVVDAVKDMPERKLFMKGVLNWVGFKQDSVTYTRDSRSTGSSRFNIYKLWNLALDGIFSFSTLPLKIWTSLGFIISLIAFFYALYMIFSKIFLGNPIPGYPSLMCSILFLGGVQLIGIGVIGEYVGRVYHEVKRRPRYILKDKIIDGKKT